MADFTSQIIKLKQQIDYYEFYSQFQELKDMKPSSANTYWTLCPFHEDKQPSFQIDMSEGRYKCWSNCSGKGSSGDCIDFYMEYYKVSKIKAVMDIAKSVNFKIELDADSQKKFEEKKEIIKFNLKLMKHFQDNLQKSQSTLKYLSSRNIIEATVDTFKLGLFNPNTILQFIKPEEYALALKAGALKVDEHGEFVPFTKMYRLMFPYLLNNYPISFTGRCFNDSIPKYLNVRNNEFYKKEDFIYGIDTAKEAIKKHGYAVIVEGNIDCLKAWQHGIKNCVATSGIRMTESQILQLKKLTKKFVLIVEDKSSIMQILKRDKGYESIYDTIKKYIPYSKVIVMNLFDGVTKVDLDDFLSNNSKGEFIKKLKESKPYNEFIVRDILKNAKINDIEDKFKYINMLKSHLLAVKNNYERDEYIKIISLALDLPIESITKILRNKEKLEIKKELPKYSNGQDSLYKNTQKCFLALLFYDKFDIYELIKMYEEYLIINIFEKEYLEIFNYIKEQIESGKGISEIRMFLETDETYKSLFLDIIFKLDIIILEEDELVDYLTSQVSLLKSRNII